jgi:hypothetical protein
VTRAKAAEVEGWRVHVARPLKDRTLQLTVEEVLEGLQAAMSREETSLNQPVGEGADGCLGDLLAAPHPGRSRGTCLRWPG